MRRFLTGIFACILVALAWNAGAVTPQKKAPPKKKSAAGKKAGTAVRKTSTTSAAAHKGAKKAPATTWRNRQLQPTPDRYREIQDALSAKGYLPLEQVNGQWDQTSTDALKKFQADQKIESNGKINSLSLIALGLGPHHDGPPVPQPPPPQVPPVPAPPKAQDR